MFDSVHNHSRKSLHILVRGDYVVQKSTHLSMKLCDFTGTTIDKKPNMKVKLSINMQEAKFL